MCGAMSAGGEGTDEIVTRKQRQHARFIPVNGKDQWVSTPHKVCSPSLAFLTVPS